MYTCVCSIRVSVAVFLLTYSNVLLKFLIISIVRLLFICTVVAIVCLLWPMAKYFGVKTYQSINQKSILQLMAKYFGVKKYQSINQKSILQLSKI